MGRMRQSRRGIYWKFSLRFTVYSLKFIVYRVYGLQFF